MLRRKGRAGADLVTVDIEDERDRREQQGEEGEEGEGPLVAHPSEHLTGEELQDKQQVSTMAGSPSGKKRQ